MASLVTQAMQRAGATVLSYPLLPAMVLTSTCCGINSTYVHIKPVLIP